MNKNFSPKLTGQINFKRLNGQDFNFFLAEHSLFKHQTDWITSKVFHVHLSSSSFFVIILYSMANLMCTRSSFI